MKRHQIDYEFDNYIREQLNGDKKPELIYDRLVNRGHDPTIVRKRIMQLCEEKRVLGDFKLNKKEPSERRPERPAATTKSPVKQARSEKGQGVPRMAKILLIIIILVGGGALAYLFLDIDIDFGNIGNGNEGEKVQASGSDSYHGQIDFISKVSDSTLIDLYPEKDFNISKKKENIEDGIHYIFKFDDPEDEVEYDIEVWDKTSVSLSDDKFISLYEDYSSVPENSNVEEYDDIGLYKGFFRIPDPKVQKSVYFYSEENFCVLVEAKYSDMSDESKNDEMTFMTGGRIKGIIYQTTRSLT